MRMATNCNPLRIGVLGTASILQTVIPAMQQSREVSVVGVASRTKDRAIPFLVPATSPAATSHA